MAGRTEMIGDTHITGNYYKNYSQKSENAEDFGALLQAGGGREEQLKAVGARSADKRSSDEQSTDPQASDPQEPKSYREQILEKMAENIKKGTIQPKFQIGAQAYTIKEWEKLLEKFDAAEEALREEVEAQIEEIKKQAEMEALKRATEKGMLDSENVTYVSESTGTAVTESMTETSTVTTTVNAVALLTDEVTKCSYPTDDPDQKHWYITWYGLDGISCKEAYFDGTSWINKDLWSFSYTEKGQYEKVMAFLERFPQDANLRFAAHENFWKDFLAGKIDEDDFVAFFETTKDGVPDYTYEKDGSTFIDRDKIKYAKYMNGFGAQFYTAEEMELIQRAIINENRKGLKRIL